MVLSTGEFKILLDATNIENTSLYNFNFKLFVLKISYFQDNFKQIEQMKNEPTYEYKQQKLFKKVIEIKNELKTLPHNLQRNS